MPTLQKSLIGIVLFILTPFYALQANEVTLKQDGKTLRADLQLVDGKDFKDGIVLLQHGTLAHNRMEIIEMLSGLLNENGYNTLSVNLSYDIDNRASAMLDCNVNHTHQHEDAINELKSWMSWLQKQGTEKVVLLGHSRGGNQVAWYATEQGQDDDLLKKVILIAPMTWNKTKAAKQYEDRYKQPIADILDNAKELAKDGKGDELVDLLGFVYCENTKASADAIVSYYQDEPRKHTPNLLPKIDQPILLVMGSEDTAVDDLPEALQKVEQENLTIETIDGADHFFRDLYSDELVELIGEFIEN